MQHIQGARIDALLRQIEEYLQTWQAPTPNLEEIRVALSDADLYAEDEVDELVGILAMDDILSSDLVNEDEMEY